MSEVDSIESNSSRSSSSSVEEAADNDQNTAVNATIVSSLEKNKQAKESIKAELRALEEDYITAMGDIKDLTVLLELQTSELNTALNTTYHKLIEQQKINNELVEKKKALTSELKEKSDLCEKLLEEQARYNQDMLEYLENCRKARNELKQEKTKVEGLSAQWRFYRNSHKQSEKMKKMIAEEIDNFFSNCGEKSLDQISKFVKKIKAQIGYEEESFEDASEAPVKAPLLDQTTY